MGDSGMIGDNIVQVRWKKEIDIKGNSMTPEERSEIIRLLKSGNGAFTGMGARVVSAGETGIRRKSEVHVYRSVVTYNRVWQSGKAEFVTLEELKDASR